MDPAPSAVIVPSCEGSIGGVYPVTAYGVSTFHSASRLPRPPPPASRTPSSIRARMTSRWVGLCRRRRDLRHRPAIAFGATKNNEDIIYVCLDNEAYMNTGIQVEFCNPLVRMDRHNARGPSAQEKHHEIMAAHYNPYSATAAVGFPQDLSRKSGKPKASGDEVHSHARSVPDRLENIVRPLPELSVLAVETNVFPLTKSKMGRSTQSTISLAGCLSGNIF